VLRRFTLYRKIFCLNVLLFILFITGVLIYKGAHAQQPKEFLPTFKGIKSPESYGSVVMNKYTGEGQPMKAVIFPHWRHRMQFTCKVCHSDIGIEMKAGASDIKMADIFEGRFCGKCHNGDIAFGVTECDKCHSYGIEVKTNKKIADMGGDFPKADFGNKIDWVKALRNGIIKPKASLDIAKNSDESKKMWIFDKDIDLPVTKFFPHPPDVVYPHKAHTEWLSCGSCHPNVFNMKAGRNPDMSMRKIISGRYCGICHGKVAFPLEDCFRCHSKSPVASPSPYTQPTIIRAP
jgi:c(7)-type cytochrome triheme protein